MTIEEAANHYASVTDQEAHGIDFIREVFIAGAEWQKQQMIEEAVEGEVHKYDKFSYVKEKNSKSLTELLAKFNDGDKVKIIIVKENEK